MEKNTFSLMVDIQWLQSHTNQQNKTDMELNETIIVKTEVPTSSCVGCFYRQIDEGDTSTTCCRPAHAALVDDCSEGDGADAKYWIFKPKTK